MAKLKNRLIDKGWHLELDGKDVGPFRTASISDMTKGNERLNSMTAMQHLRQGYRVQKNSYLRPEEWLKPAQTREVLEDSTEKYYTQAIGEVANKRAAHGWEGVGFAAVDKKQFSNGEPYIAMYYRPATFQKDERDFSRANVVKKNGHKENLEELILRQSLERVNGNNLLVASVALEEQLEQAKRTGFKALAPDFAVPPVSARKEREYRQPAPTTIYLLVRTPEENNARYKHGVPLNKAFQIFHSLIREGYIDESAVVRDGKERPTTRIKPAEAYYFDGIVKLVESAVKYGDKTIIPYKGVDVKDSALRPLTIDEKDKLMKKYLELGKKEFPTFKYHPRPK